MSGGMEVYYILDSKIHTPWRRSDDLTTVAKDIQELEVSAATVQLLIQGCRES